MSASRIEYVEQAVAAQYHQVRMPDEIPSELMGQPTTYPQNLWHIYAHAPTAAKRLMNQALFEYILVDRSSCC